MDDDKVIICRCEDISLKDVRQLIGEGYDTVDDIKRILRCGMGPCQGKTCGFTIAREIARASGKTIDEVTWRQSLRPPVGGVTFDEILEGRDEK